MLAGLRTRFRELKTLHFSQNLVMVYGGTRLRRDTATTVPLLYAVAFPANAHWQGVSMRIDEGSQCALTQTSIRPQKKKGKSDMAKPILKFTAVPYGIGEFKGYRPQLEAQNPVSDLDFCREVVTEKRLAMSADEPVERQLQGRHPLPTPRRRREDHRRVVRERQLRHRGEARQRHVDRRGKRPERDQGRRGLRGVRTTRRGREYRPRPERFRPYLNVISYAHPS